MIHCATAEGLPVVDRSVAQGELGSAGLHRELREENSPTPVSLVKTNLISQRKLEANRANAKKSTGPRTARLCRWNFSARTVGLKAPHAQFAGK